MRPSKRLTEVDRRTRQSRATSLARERSQMSLTLKLITFQRHIRRTLHIYVLYCNPITVAPDELPLSMQTKCNNLREAEVPPMSPPIPSPGYCTVHTHTQRLQAVRQLSRRLCQGDLPHAGYAAEAPRGDSRPRPTVRPKPSRPSGGSLARTKSARLWKSSHNNGQSHPNELRTEPPQRTPHRMHVHEGTYYDCQHNAMLARIKKCAVYCMDVLYKLYVAEALWQRLPGWVGAASY